MPSPNNSEYLITIRLAPETAKTYLRKLRLLRTPYIRDATDILKLSFMEIF